MMAFTLRMGAHVLSDKSSELQREIEAAVQPDLGDRDLHRDRGVADADRLAGFKQQLASAFDLLAG